MKKDFDFYYPIFDYIAIEPIYEGELYGLDHKTAKKRYYEMKAAGFYDDDEYDY